MKKLLVYLSSILLSLSLGASTMLSNETPVMLCSGTHPNGSRANVEITKFWHHLEPGMEPDTSYEFSYAYIGENSLGNWGEAGSVAKGSFSLTHQEMMNAKKAGQLTIEEKQINVAYYFGFDLNLNTKEATISHQSGKSIKWGLSLQCTGFQD
jgi:hypothetical protein